MNYQFNPIGVIHSCFKQRFGIPRQPGLVKSARGWIEFFPPYDRQEAFVGLQSFSYLWVVFLFHQSLKNRDGFVVRPPRSAGRRKLGVFATRAPSRPNQLGQSVVTLEDVEVAQGKVRLYLKGVDMVEGTPVLDVKPYLPCVDVQKNACGGFAHTAPKIALVVEFSVQAVEDIERLEDLYPDLQQLIGDVLQHDPRPAYYCRGTQKSEFSIQLYDLDVYWQMLEDKRVRVMAIDKAVS